MQSKDSAIGDRLSKRSAFVYDGPGPLVVETRLLLSRLYWDIVAEPSAATVAIAPRLHERLSAAALEAPQLGVLVFHPSALPYRRGPDAIRNTIRAGERVSAATWFWATDRLDAGPICEQEVVVLPADESPGRAYHTRFVPAAVRALERALKGIALQIPRRVGQEEALATYDRAVGDSNSIAQMGPG